jgi:peptide/nickel transport system ATP-binding protein
MSSFIVDKLEIRDNSKKLVDISFSFESSLAIIGQSGSGKSLTLKAILSLLPDNLSTKIEIKSDFDLISNNISFVPQNPFTALSPLTKISEQFFVDDEKKKSLLQMVNLDIDFLDKYPSQLSGGQLQRVIIAMALEKEPKLILFDEPTTALDNITKESILSLIVSLQKQLNCLIIFVTHDIDTILDICKFSLILKDGAVVEFGNTSDVFSNPKSEYTKNLIASSFKNREFRV